MGDVLSLSAATRPRRGTAQGPRAWAARPARRRRERSRPDQCGAERRLFAGRAAKAGIHGEREGDLGTAGTASASAAVAVVRLRAWILAEGAGTPGCPGGCRRIFCRRREAREGATQRRGNEHACEP